MAKKIQINKDRGRDTRQTDSIYDNPIDLPQDFGVIPSTGIIKRDDGSLEVSNIRIHRTGLEFVGEVSEDEYEIFGQTLLQIDTAYQWIVGDYLVYGDQKAYGQATEFAEQLGKSPQTLWNWAAVARSVETSRRREVLSFGHHEVVASLSEHEQDYWLEKAALGNEKDGEVHKVWSVKKLRQEIAAAKGESVASANPVAFYERLANQFDDGLTRLLVQHKKAKTQQDKNNIRRVLENVVEHARQALDELDND